MSPVRIVSYGGGVNSTAMVVELVRRGEMPSAVVFSDTGGEKPETYAYLKTLDAWLLAHGAPALVTVKKGGLQETLEEHCLRTGTLPSLAYGFHRCASKFKVEPMDRWRNNFPPAAEAKARGEKVEKCVGFDAGEDHRAERAKARNDTAERLRFPLIEWDMGRRECVAAIEAAGLPIPPKSACFFCPATKASQVLWLAKEHPDLFERAVAIERNGDIKEGSGPVGLGRRFSWEALVKADKAQLRMFEGAPDVACACLDEDEEAK